MRTCHISALGVVLAGIALTSCGGSSPTTGTPAAAKEMHATGSTQNLTRSDLAPVCFLDQIGDVLNPAINQPAHVSVAKDLAFGGWAVDDAAKRVAGGVDVVIDGTPMSAEYGSPRKDVATALKKPEYAAAGFVLALPSGQLAKGQHTVVLRVISNDKKTYYQSPGVVFIVD